MELIRKWIDLAHDQGSVLFLYGHQVLPDAEFVNGTVEAATLHTLTATVTIKPVAEPDLYLVPDTAQRFLGVPMRVVSIEGKQIQVARRSGSTDPTWGYFYDRSRLWHVRQFREMIVYAAQRLKFYTVHQVVNEPWRQN